MATYDIIPPKKSLGKSVMLILVLTDFSATNFTTCLCWSSPHPVSLGVWSSCFGLSPW